MSPASASWFFTTSATWEALIYMYKAESETADLWQPKWNENQTVLAAAIQTPDRDTDPLEGAAAGFFLCSFLLK